MENYESHDPGKPLPPDGDQSVPRSELREGDRIEARDGFDPPAIIHGTITLIEGDAITLEGGRVLPDGFQVEIVGRAPVTLPDTLTLITATLKTGEQVTLMGMGSVWTSTSGAPVHPEQITAWEEA